MLLLHLPLPKRLFSLGPGEQVDPQTQLYWQGTSQSPGLEPCCGLKDKGGEWHLEMGLLEQDSQRLLARRKQVKGFV